MVVVTRLTEERAAEFAALPFLERRARLDELRAEHENLEGEPEAIRGPICMDCRVDWETVHADVDEWPCPGQRPDRLGGPMASHLQRPSLTRQQRRAQRRQAVKGAARRDAHDAKVQELRETMRITTKEG